MKINQSDITKLVRCGNRGMSESGTTKKSGYYSHIEDKLFANTKNMEKSGNMHPLYKHMILFLIIKMKVNENNYKYSLKHYMMFRFLVVKICT